jgi:hypothetical protein
MWETNLNLIIMPYVVLKETQMMNQRLTILVNDNEGIPMEFDTLEKAEQIAKLFESNSLSGNKYSVKKML